MAFCSSVEVVGEGEDLPVGAGGLRGREDLVVGVGREGGPGLLELEGWEGGRGCRS